MKKLIVVYTKDGRRSDNMMEKFLKMFAAIFAAILFTFFVAIPIEIIHTGFTMQPLAARVFLYGLTVCWALWFIYDRVDVETLDDRDDDRHE